MKQTNERAATRVARNIVEEIRERALPPGTRLDAEHLMVEKQDVARATVGEARKAVYPVLVAEAAENPTHQDIAEMRQCLVRYNEAIANTGNAVVEACQFYELVARASKNLVLGLLRNALHRMSESVRVQYGVARWRASLRDVTRILDAIERGEGDSAREISIQTLEAAMRDLERNAPETLNKPVAWILSE